MGHVPSPRAPSEGLVAAATPHRPSGSAGRIPLVMRAGITGHRWPHDDAEARRAVAAALADLFSRCANHATKWTPVTAAVLSSLAEGADRLAADWAVRNGVRLEAVLPLPPDEYATDFATEESRAHFRELLDAAAAVSVVPKQESREDAYRAAGEAVVQRSDVLLAVWDGECARGVGGTAEIVQAAAAMHVPVYWLRAERHDGTTYTIADVVSAPVHHVRPVPAAVQLLSEPAFRMLDRYNRARLLAPTDPRLGRTDHPTARRLADLYYRADRMAVQARDAMLRASRLLYSLAVVAVGVAAGQLVFMPHRTWPIWLEFSALVLILGILLLGRRSRLLDRWLSIRLFAERLRSSYFLALIGASPALGTVQTDLEAPSTTMEWTGRAVREALLSAPAPTRDAIDLECGKRELLAGWIDDQLEYQCHVVDRAQRRHRLSQVVTLGLFSLSLAAALMHVMHWLRPETAPEYWSYISVVAPAAGAAVGAYAEQREYERQRIRARRMVQLLGQAHDDVVRTKTVTDLRRSAEALDLVLQGESADWFSASRLHELTVP